MNTRRSSPTNVLQDCCEYLLPPQPTCSLPSSFHKSHVSTFACKYQTIVSYPTLIYYFWLVPYMTSWKISSPRWILNFALRCGPHWCYNASKASRFFFFVPIPPQRHRWGCRTYCMKQNFFLAVKLLKFTNASFSSFGINVIYFFI